MPGQMTHEGVSGPGPRQAPGEVPGEVPLENPVPTDPDTPFPDDPYSDPPAPDLPPVDIPSTPTLWNISPFSRLLKKSSLKLTSRDSVFRMLGGFDMGIRCSFGKSVFLCGP